MVITEYDELRDEHYMTTWTASELYNELKKVTEQEKYDEKHSDYFHAIWEQISVNRQI